MSEPAMKWNGGEGDAAASAQAVLPAFLRNDIRPSKSSHIEIHEIDKARDLVEKQWLDASGGKPLKFRPAGYKILLKLYVRPEEIELGSTGFKLKLHDDYRAEDKFYSCTGLVVAMGEQCYTGTLRDGSPRYPEGPWCRVGDWVCINLYNGSRVTINGVACLIINDDSVQGVIDEPADIEAGHRDHKAPA